MEFKIAINRKFNLGLHWQRKRKGIDVGWLSLQIKIGQYIPLRNTERGIYKYK
ncbi:hypothetical protein SAMN05660742_111110 [Propionispira arboris]|uniref:Uncharacterized protein n=1 Tax=Propionispira arboris TaxID=84035 RepID=A0A1H7A312_9FIRM|nr:hypothetical protein SAMN05660742_111110 [Propionispira arboris]